jgi:hypothetical protein
LQAKARKNDNSVMIDEDFKPYDDQWDFLSNIRKIDEAEIDSYISKLGCSNELGDLRQTDEEDTKPWEKNHRIDTMLNENDVPHTINIVKANMLYIHKKGFSNKALNIMKRLAAFRNPDFYKAQAMRLPTYNKPRIISLSEETVDYLCLPRGCDIDLINLFEHLKTNIKWIDETFSGKAIKVKFKKNYV